MTPLRLEVMDELAVLEKARALVAGGWTQGTWERVSWSKRGPKKCYCSLGALRAVCGMLLLGTEKLNEAAGEGIVTFNDKRSTTKRDVLAVFDKAISKLKEERSESGNRDRVES